jgi:hypothetical protein
VGNGIGRDGTGQSPASGWSCRDSSHRPRRQRQPPAQASTTAQAPAPAPPPNLDLLLARYDAETDPDNAFGKLFKLWGIRYVAGSTDPCTQAQQAGLEVPDAARLAGAVAPVQSAGGPQRGRLRRTRASAGPRGTGRRARADRSRRRATQIGIGDLSRSWFGDYILLWRAGGNGSEPLALGARNARVKWLRDSLRRVNGLPAEEMQDDRFDATLVTLVEDFQRKNRLAVDGIAGVQTQVALDAALNDATTPFLHNAAGS